jgi:hypothetical protein
MISFCGTTICQFVIWKVVIFFISITKLIAFCGVSAWQRGKKKDIFNKGPFIVYNENFCVAVICQNLPSGCQVFIWEQKLLKPYPLFKTLLLLHFKLKIQCIKVCRVGIIACHVKFLQHYMHFFLNVCQFNS